MLGVTDRFHEAEQADVNKPSSQVYLILGNYATAAFGSSASASGAAANYPASGAIDGDRTEINVGPASGADNDIGQSSWRSTVAPDTTPQTLIIDLGSTRIVNRIKLYHLSSHGLSSYKIEYSTGGAFTLIDKTTDQGGNIATTHELDVIDFDDVTCTQIKITISGTVVAADMANIVELEIYRLVDISDRLISVKTSRSRDYQLANSLAATASLVVSNVDKYFSPSYIATLDSEADFINSELKPGIGVIIKYGYDYTGSLELVQNFIGTIDKITIKPGQRTAMIECRDAMKQAFNSTTSTKLKTSQDSGDLVQYMLNKANISTWETDIDQTGITIDYFFTNEETIIETIRQLVEGAGDANFYIDENGIATFRGYMGSIALSDTGSDAADFTTGNLTNIDLTTEPGKIKRKWFQLDNFSDGQYTTNPVWTVNQLAFTVTGSNHLRRTTGGGGTGEAGHISTPQPYATGTWQFSLASAPSIIAVNFMSENYISNGGGPDVRYYSNGYAITYSEASGSGSVGLIRTDSLGLTSLGLGSYAISGGSGTVTIRVSRDSSGVFNVYVNGILRISASDTTYSTSTLFGVTVRETVTPTDYAEIYDIHYSQTSDNTTDATTGQAIFISSAIDQGSSISSEGLFNATTIVPSGTSISFYTATSDDNVTYDAYVSATAGGSISSTPRRYIKWKAVLTCPVDDGNHNFVLTTPTITDVTVTWYISSGSSGGSSQKFPSTVSFIFDETLNIDIDQIYADTVAGGSAIINSIGVQAQPLVLDGSDSDVQWQGTSGVPPVDISVSNPLGVTNGQTLTYQIVVNGGMDISRMSGANPAAAAITFAGGGAGSWVFSSIHPTRPILVITISGTGTITNLQVQGKSFASDDKFLEATDSDTDSIKEFGERKSSISNQFIVNSALALQIAQRLIDNLAEPITYTPQIKVRPTFSVQIGDRVTLSDSILGISEDNIVIGVEQFIGSSISAGEAYTILKLLKI